MSRSTRSASASCGTADLDHRRDRVGAGAHVVLVDRARELRPVLRAVRAPTAARSPRARYSVPSFTGTAPPTLRHMLARFPAETLGRATSSSPTIPGWAPATSSTSTSCAPVFRGGRLVGYSMSITHLPDIGGARLLGHGRGRSTRRGCACPSRKLVRARRAEPRAARAHPHQRARARQVIGDIMANITCNEVGGRLLLEFMDEYEHRRPRTARRRDHRASPSAPCASGSRAIPDGRLRATASRSRAIDAPITLACAVDDRGRRRARRLRRHRRRASTAASTCRSCYTRAFADYAIKCLTTPMMPNNEGSLRPITVVGARGLHPERAAAVADRRAAHRRPLRRPADLRRARPGRRAATGPGRLRHAEPAELPGHGTGTGATSRACSSRPAASAPSTASTAPRARRVPSNMTVTPVEIWENVTSTLMEKKALAAGLRRRRASSAAASARRSSSATTPGIR